MRLFLISIATLICAFLILIIIRFWGLSMPTYKFEHEFYNFSTSSRPLKAKVFHSEEAMKNDLQTNPDLLVYISTYITSDHVFIIDTDQNLENQLFSLKTSPKENLKFKGRYIHNYSFEELKLLKSDLLKLEDVLSAFGKPHSDSKPNSEPHKQKFILSLKSNAPDIHKDFIQLMEKLKLEKQILIQSDYDVVLKSIKDEKPMYTFGTSLSELMRLKTFSTIFLEPAISMKGDTLISELNYKGRPLVTQQIIDEIKRRQKLVFLGPLTSEAEVEAASKLNPDLIILN